MNMLISIWVWVGVGILTTLVLIIQECYKIIFFWRFNDGRFGHRLSYWWGKFIVFLNPFWELKIIGTDNIKTNQAYVLICNHQSMADIMFLSCIGLDYKWVAKESLFRVPVFGWA